jgi:hypothetical protein
LLEVDRDEEDKLALLDVDELPPHTAVQALKFWKGLEQLPKGLQFPCSQHTPFTTTEELELDCPCVQHNPISFETRSPC